jgi:LysM repeat protein
MQHKVKRGESLEKIAAKYDVAIADLKSWNKLRSSRINAGEILEVYAPDQTDEPADEPAVKKRSSAATSKKKPTTHVVRRGETLEAIAEKYSVSISELKKWNDLKNARIMAGQRLKIMRVEDPV